MFYTCLCLTLLFSFFPFQCLTFGFTDSHGGRPAGGGRRCSLCWGQHAGSGTQDAGPGAGQGIAEAQQARYPGHLWRRHPTTG